MQSNSNQIKLYKLESDFKWDGGNRESSSNESSSKESSLTEGSSNKSSSTETSSNKSSSTGTKKWN